jgi:hypothetical protein
MIKEYLEALRNKAAFWGKMTWMLLYIQLMTFGMGVFFLMISLCLIFYSKLFPAG